MIETADNPVGSAPAAAAGETPAIRVVDLATVFEGRAVLDGVTFDVPRGQTLVVMGPSGCGKTTLLRHLVGAMRPTRGRVELLGHDLNSMSETGMDELRRRFGILFQSGALFNSMTVAENIALPLREHTRLDDSTIDVIVKMKLELVNLRAAANRMPSEISGGMKKRAGLARAIALDPEVLFYDEPSAGLDPVTSAEIDQLIMDLTCKLGVTSVVVTHEMDSAFRIADTMVMLDEGKVLRMGRRQEFEAMRDGPETGDRANDLIRQFLSGSPHGPITERRLFGGYSEDILTAAGKVRRPVWMGWRQ